MKSRHVSFAMITQMILLGFCTVALADDHWSDDWKIEVEGKAKSAGTIGFQINFEPGEDGTAADPVNIDVLVPEKAKDNDVADTIANNFSAVLDGESYKVNQSWGENVTIHGRRNAADFELTMTNNSVQGISIEIDD